MLDSSEGWGSSFRYLTSGQNSNVLKDINTKIGREEFFLSPGPMIESLVKASMQMCPGHSLQGQVESRCPQRNIVLLVDVPD